MYILQNMKISHDANGLFLKSFGSKQDFFTFVMEGIAAICAVK